ncbi:MAG: hypothetical protein GY942_18600, partial [Aestuariibacter sp.]|nr:hypothetical protein [Aestuariibacter sp.]
MCWSQLNTSPSLALRTLAMPLLRLSVRVTISPGSNPDNNSSRPETAVNGKPQRSCVTPISEVGDNEVTTIEATNTPQAKAVQAAWQELDVVQCGYC